LRETAPFGSRVGANHLRTEGNAHAFLHSGRRRRAVIAASRFLPRLHSLSLDTVGSPCMKHTLRIRGG
jgi:hypothetical protein